MTAPAWFVPPDPVDAHTARAVHRTEGLSHPERKLRLAVLEDVVGILLGTDNRRPEPESDDYAIARRWVAADDRGQPFSFVLVCEALGMEATSIRAALLSGAPRPAPVAGPTVYDRLLAWGRQQVTPWAVADAASALGVPEVEARHAVNAGLRAGTIEVFRRAVNQQAGLYWVRR